MRQKILFYYKILDKYLIVYPSIKVSVSVQGLFSEVSICRLSESSCHISKFTLLPHSWCSLQKSPSLDRRSRTVADARCCTRARHCSLLRSIVDRHCFFLFRERTVLGFAEHPRCRAYCGALDRKRRA